MNRFTGKTALVTGASRVMGREIAVRLAGEGCLVAVHYAAGQDPVFGIPEAVEQMAQLSAFGRVREPRDIADVVAFLASADARWVTGAPAAARCSAEQPRKEGGLL